VRLKRLTVPPFESLARLMRGISFADPKTREQVSRIIDAVRNEGDRAVERFQREFDRAPLDAPEWELPRSRADAALARIDRSLREALECAAQRIRDYYQRSLVLAPDPYQQYRQKTGELCFIGERVIPLDKVGVYVPGGQAAYPSTVLMNVIPARVRVSVDVRAPDGERVDEVLAVVPAELSRTEEVAMASEPTRALREQLEQLGVPVVELASGAGHDAGVLATAGVPTAMLFVRSLNGGISHSPDELSAQEDIEQAVAALASALVVLAASVDE
jgi:histidinol dehydrogenase